MANNMILLHLLFLTMQMAFVLSLGHKCIHDTLHQNITSTDETTVHVDRRSRQPLDIQLRYTKEFDEHPKVHYLKEQVLSKAVKKLSDVLSTTEKPTSPITMQLHCDGGLAVRVTFPDTGVEEVMCHTGCTSECLDIELPPELKGPCVVYRNEERVEDSPAGPGISAEFVLLVDARESPRCARNQNTLAYAVACSTSSSNGSPRVGAINFCTSCTSKLPDNMEEAIDVATHEILHSLGFSNTQFQTFWINGKATSALSKRTMTIKTVGNTSVNADFQVITTPKAVENARKYFNCEDSTFDFVALEDEGGSGTRGSHLEQFLYGSAYMTGSNLISPDFHPVELGILEDSGWYYVTYPDDKSNWAKGAGCDFALRGCKDMVDEEYETFDDDPFCDGQNVNQCVSKTSFGRCPASRYASHGSPYKYLPGNSDGSVVVGTLPLTNGCPVRMELYHGDCLNAARAERYNMLGMLDYYHGADAACFPSMATMKWTLTKSGRGFRIPNARDANCYKMRCLNGKLEVELGEAFLACPTDGGHIRFIQLIQGYMVDGGLACPPYTAYCEA